MDARRSLAQPSARFTGDDGAPDPLVRAALAGARGQTGYLRAVVALCTARLLMPIVASGDEGGDAPDPDRHAEMAAVTLSDGEATHLVAFTGIDAMRAWQPTARPVLCFLDELAATVEPAGATRLLIDPAGPAPLVLADGLVAPLAEGNRLVEFDDGSFAWVRPEASQATPDLGGASSDGRVDD